MFPYKTLYTIIFSDFFFKLFVCFKPIRWGLWSDGLAQCGAQATCQVDGALVAALKTSLSWKNLLYILYRILHVIHLHVLIQCAYICLYKVLYSMICSLPNYNICFFMLKLFHCTIDFLCPSMAPCRKIGTTPRRPRPCCARVSRSRVPC